MMLETIDIEAALQAALEADGMSASAPPIPSTLGANLPHIHVERVGGWQENIVQDMHEVNVHVYDEHEYQAMMQANALTGWLKAKVGDELDGCPVYAVNIATLPYNNRDPLHESLARATMRVQILTRTA